jgi:hypothetical protein
MNTEGYRSLKYERSMTSHPMPCTFRQFEQEDNFCQHVSLDAFQQVIPPARARGGIVSGWSCWDQEPPLDAPGGRMVDHCSAPV